MLHASAIDFLDASGGLRVAGLKGKVAAASLHVAVLRPDGTSLHEGLGGLDLIQEIARGGRLTGDWKYALRPDPFGDPVHLREGVARAFEAAPASDWFLPRPIPSLASEGSTDGGAPSALTSALLQADSTSP